MGLVGLNVGLKQKAASWRLAKRLILLCARHDSNVRPFGS